jgi:hypothetical protein
MLPEIDYSQRDIESVGYEYVIITPDNQIYLPWAEAIKNFRNEQGIKTGVYTLTQVGGNTKEAIEAFVNNAYNTWEIPPVAVLLLADFGTGAANSNGITSPFKTTSTTQFVSDHFYADVDNDDIAEIVFARITAQNDAHLVNTVKKFLDYERNPPTNPDYYDKPVTAMGWQDDRWFQLCSEIVNGFWEKKLQKHPVRENAGTPSTAWSTAPNTNAVVNYFGPNALNYIPQTPQHLTDWGGNATRLNADINRGAFMISYRNHGWVDKWNKPEYSISNMSGLNNNDLPFVLSFTCYTGMFNYGSEVFAEAFHRYPKRALGLIAATYESYSFVNDTYVWGMFDHMWPDFMPANGQPGPASIMPSFGNVAGKLFLQASGWPSNTDYKKVTYYLFHHFGDAFSTVYSEVPQNLTVVHEPFIITGQSTFTVSANPGALIALSKNSEILAVATAGASPVNFNLPVLTQGEMIKLTITKQNFYRYSVEIPVCPPQQDIIVRNLVNNLDYGTVWVNSVPKNSGSLVNVPTGYNSFGTHPGVILDQQKFRRWNKDNNQYFNPASLLIKNNEPVIASFHPTFALNVINNLEGGSSNVNYNIKLNISGIQENILANPYYAFQYNETFDRYEITATHNFNAYNTSWRFSHWDNRDVNPVKSNVEITGPTTFTAYYKGNLRSNSPTALNTSQRKFQRFPNYNFYFTIYESMNRIWYTLTDDFHSNWEAEVDLLNTLSTYNININSSGSATNPSIDIYDDSIHVVFEYRETLSSPVKLCYFAMDYYSGGISSIKIFDNSIPSTFFGQVKPVIACFELASTDNQEKVIYFKTNPNAGYHYRQYAKSQGFYDWRSGTLDYTFPLTVDISIAPARNTTDHILHFTHHDLSSVKYAMNTKSRRGRSDNYSVISSGSSFASNVYPSISLTGSESTIVVSWKGFNGPGIGKDEAGITYPHKMVTRVKQNSTWGDFFIAGDNVSFVNNNSVSSSSPATVIAWSESDGTISKWIKRVGTTYCNLSSLSHNGAIPVISDGSTLDNIEVMVLNRSQLPYLIDRCTNNFNLACDGGGGGGDLGKITSSNEFTYGRSGVVLKNGIEFVFNIGDVLVGDSAVNFIYVPDTLLYSSDDEMNNAVRTENFNLNSNSSFIFTNYYYVLHKDAADTGLSELDRVSFRAELVNAVTNEVIGTFDNITYDKLHLDDYNNISYQVNCGGIQNGEYYLRLVTSTTGQSNYNLANAQNYASLLQKKSLKEVYYDGSGMPEDYDLSQNYPNPFNPVTTIRYQIPADGFVTLKLYDILGKEVKILAEGYKNRGKYSVTFDASNLASGTYIYRLQSGEFNSSKKMMLVK